MQKNLFEEDNSNIKTDVTNQKFIIVKDTAIQNSLSSKKMFIYIFINLKLNFDFILKNSVVMDVQFFEDDSN